MKNNFPNKKNEMNVDEPEVLFSHYSRQSNR